MPRSVTRLNLSEKYDREAQEHIRKAIEFEEAAVNTTAPSERGKYGIRAREEREAAITQISRTARK